VAIAIVAYRGDDGLFDEDFYMETTSVTSTSLSMVVVMEGTTNIRILNVMYLAVKPDFQYHLNTFNDIEANFSMASMTLDPINVYNTSERTFINNINYTQLCSTITTSHTEFGT
jgi:hypothetical protein